MAKARTATASAAEMGNEFWWRAAVGAPVHERVVPYGRSLQDLYRPAHAEDRVHERIYEARRLRGYRQAIAALKSQAGISAARLNASKAVVDTVVSRLSKDRPMPSFDVNDGDWLLKRKAKEYRKFIVGKMMETEFDDLSRDSLRDGGIIGTGITRIDDRDDDVFAERVLREELLFDPRECKYAKPRQAIYVHRIARAYLAELYPEAASAIARAPASKQRWAEDDDEFSRGLDTDGYVDVFEAWHLPSTKDSKDGRRALVGEGFTLVSEIWECIRFPFALFRYTKPLRGMWGKGLIAELADLQHRINCIVRDMQMNLSATGRGYYAIQETADVPIEMLSGFQPFKLKYKGNQAPTFTVPTAINPAQVEMLKFFMQQMFELTGVSQAAAASRSALGPGASGVALDTQYDIDSERFAMVQAQYARYRLDAAQLYLDAAKRVAKRRAEGKGEKRAYVAMWKSKDSIQRLEYAKVKLEDGDYSMSLEPVNYIPDTRAGKLSVVTQLAQAGVIPQWLVASLFDEPDIAQANNIQLAPFNNCMRKMDDLADESLPVPSPEPYNDLELEKKIAVAFYNRVQNDKAPEEIQERYRQYCDLVEDMINKAKATDPNAPPATANANMPPGAVGPNGPPSMPGAAPMIPPGAPMPAQMAS